METADIVVIGAGAVGLAVAETLSRTRPRASLIVIERQDSFGREASSRNSEVVHAGIYYPNGTLKARLCVRGKEMLYSFLAEHEIPHRRVGKLIVASTQEEIGLLEELAAQARKNGVTDLEMLSPARIAELEPNIKAEAALYSPSTGILDTHAYMKTLAALAEKRGALFAYGAEVTGIEKSGDRYTVRVRDADGEELHISAEAVVNCAGLASDAVAAMAGIDIDRADYRLHLSKGEYFSIQGLPRWALSHLVYPVPGTTWLGIHTVIDLQGQIKLGPNAFFTDTVDYTVDPAHAEEFFKAAVRYLPFLKRESLVPDMAGLRAKLQKPGERFRDFVIVNESERGLPGFINCVGIESPGLTSSLAIAEYVAEIL
ncbi:MAG TPA: NAD(P)/FAD-dependent oxidoreductase [Spirochaetia bacterium]|nr:NAD(P)/FAD-dependent oxidoreductase [Spirochaetia bacterium]